MPLGDRTGPRGLGPMTGRAMGYCGGYPEPGCMNPGPWFGFSRGYGFGRGYGRGRGFGRGRNWQRGGRMMPYGYPFPHNYPYGTIYPVHYP
jgi:hypothetical protein